jgi:hypothetical protein
MSERDSPMRDAEAERAVMGAVGCNPEFNALPAQAAAILGQVCADPTSSMERVTKAINVMRAEGAIEPISGVGPIGAKAVIRFENLAYENRYRIRMRELRWADWRFEPPPSPVRPPIDNISGPWLPIAAFSASMQPRLRDALEQKMIWTRTDADELVAESDYLPFHDASQEATYIPLSRFRHNPGFVEHLLADHTQSPILTVRSGIVCVSWNVINEYAATGSSSLQYELEPDDVPLFAPF